MNVSGKTFIFLFGTIFLAIVLGKLSATYVEDQIAASQAAKRVAPSEPVE